MGGKVLEYEAKTILKKGIAQGLTQGHQEGLVHGKFSAYAELIRDGFITISEAAKRLDIPVEKLEDFMNKNE